MVSKLRRGLSAVLVSCAALVAATAAHAVTLEISITNNAGSGGPTLTPLFVGVHNGSFDAFTVGQAASPGLELIAEDGDPSKVIDELNNADAGAVSGVITAPQGFGPAPLIEPGETGSIQLAVDGNTNRFLSFLSMILPSNDQFIGNGDPMAHELFDGAGTYLGDRVIEVTGAQAYDAGTEANIGHGAPFQGAFGDPAVDEGGVVGIAQGIDIFAGITLPNGNVLNAGEIGFGGGNPDFSVATIRVSAVPVPAALPLIIGGLGLMGFAARRRSA